MQNGKWGILPTGGQMEVGDLVRHHIKNKIGLIVKKSLDKRGGIWVIIKWSSGNERHPISDPWIKLCSEGEKKR